MGFVGSILLITHSIRKVSATLGINHPYSTSFIRAGWILPGATGRYILSADSRDYTLSRILAGLKMGSEDFEALPPHFNPEFLRNTNLRY